MICAISISSASGGQHQQTVAGAFSVAEAELREAVEAIAQDVMDANIEGLQAAHLASHKFSKFGPRKFERQDVNDANASEAAFFSSISNVDYRINDLKVDVLGDVAIVTYYPHVSFRKDGESRVVHGRQTLVFLQTDDGWKIVHEHGTVRP
jgi:ketosteroid isomerase-like protein